MNRSRGRRSKFTHRKYWSSGNNEEQRQDEETPPSVSHIANRTTPLPHYNSSNSNQSFSLCSRFSFDHVPSKQRILDLSSCASPTSPLTSQVIESSIINISSVDSFEQVDAATETPIAILKDSSAQVDQECFHTMDSSGQVHSTDSDSGNWSTLETQYLINSIAELGFSRFSKGCLEGTQESNFYFLVFSCIQAYLKHHIPSFSRSLVSIR